MIIMMTRMINTCVWWVGGNNNEEGYEGGEEEYLLRTDRWRYDKVEL